ncbi:unnamed protein product [Lota lota]
MWSLFTTQTGCGHCSPPRQDVVTVHHPDRMWTFPLNSCVVRWKETNIRIVFDLVVNIRVTPTHAVYERMNLFYGVGVYRPGLSLSANQRELVCSYKTLAL